MMRSTALFCLVALLAACGARGPKERINPPTVSVQELRIEGERCSFQLRVHNHSTVGMRYATLSFDRFTVDGRELAPVSLTPALEVPPNTGEPIAHELPCPGMTGNASELIYRLQGHIDSDEPRERSFPFTYSSRLLPVPGLSGVYR